MLTLTFLVKTFIDLYVMILILRIWMRWVECDFYNPFSQFIVKITQPVVRIIQSILPSTKKIDTSAFARFFINDAQISHFAVYSRRRRSVKSL